MFKILFVLVFLVFCTNVSFASITEGTIDSTDKYAEGLQVGIGKINFGTTEGDVKVTDDAITGYAWGGNLGWINLAPSFGGVENDAEGNLSGYAWGERTGWINFNPTNGGVTIDSDGYFNGYAWAENAGWISFNCDDEGVCGSDNYKVRTDWRPQSTRPQCSDGADNDGDGDTDFPDDAGCTSVTDNDETDTVGGGDDDDDDDGGGGSIFVTISPSSATLLLNDLKQFSATVNGTANQGVTWSVIETNGGVISPNGLYTANVSLPGVYTIQATSRANPEKFDTATITVVGNEDGAPTITLLGNNPVSIHTGEEYNEAGAHAFDAEDGDISGDVTISGFVDTLTSGVYALMYKVSDSSGQSAIPQTRTILVGDYICGEGEENYGWLGSYFSYSSAHPDMQPPRSEWGKSHGDPLSSAAPWTADWYDIDKYFRFYRLDQNLSFGANFFPFDNVPEEVTNGHEHHFGVHWQGDVRVPTTGSYSFTFASDDDSWVYLNGNLVGSSPGVHGASTRTGTMTLSANQDNRVDIFFAERQTTQAHFTFHFSNPNVEVFNPLPDVFNTCPDDEPPPIESCAQSVVAGDGDLVQGSGPAVPTYDGNPAWTANIPGATWIWDSEFVSDPTNNETRVFVKNFILNVEIESATLQIAADNRYRFWINGEFVAQDLNQNNYSLANQDTHDVTEYLVSGNNTMMIEVVNIGGSSNPTSNPAGLLYRLDVVPASGEITSCPFSIPPTEDEFTQCSDGIDNDGDSLADALDSACHTDGNAANPASYNASINNENSAPTLVLFGADPITLLRLSTFTDPGATAIDSEDGDITANIIVTGSVDTTVANTYTLTYRVTDSSGLSAVETRQVIILPEENPDELAQCEDGIDNDGDGLVDFPFDPGCSNLDDPSETTPSEVAPPDEDPIDDSDDDDSIVDDILNGIDDIAGVLTGGAEKLFDFLTKTPIGEKIVETLPVVGAAIGALSLVPAVASSFFSLSDIVLALSRAWNALLSLLGLRKRRRPWGTVYDSITKQPLDPAYVVLQNLEGEEIDTAITDLDGRYGFLMKPGVYKIVANKTNYIFPSKRLMDKTQDEIYDNLYFGEEIVVDEMHAVVNKNIPMDPEGFDWNEFAKKSKRLMKFYTRSDYILSKIFKILFWAGFVFSTVMLILDQNWFNVSIFAVYIAIILLRAFGLKPRTYGVLQDASGNPLSFAVVRAYTEGIGQEIGRKVADRYGRYYMLVPPGKYYVKIEERNTDETYRPVFTSGTINAKKGIINRFFKL